MKFQFNQLMENNLLVLYNYVVINDLSTITRKSKSL
jgi:hypothetical protein